MYSSEIQSVKSEIKRWWEIPRNLRWDELFDNKDSNSFRMQSRQAKVLHYLDSLKLKKNSKILELGFGAGQTAKMILKKNYLYDGIDISSQLTNCAKKRCIEYVKEGRARFHVGSIDEKLNFEDHSFDVVIAVGVFQYAINISTCFKEIRRVLKKEGFFIICQTNMYDIQRMLTPRLLFLRCIYALGGEEFELAPSIKSILLNSKLGSIFQSFQNLKFFRLKFVTKGHIEYKFGFRKRLFSIWRISKILDQHSFFVLKKSGSPFFYSTTGKYWGITKFFNSLFNLIADKRIIPFLSGFADNIVLLTNLKK